MRPGQLRVFDGLRLTTEHVTHLQEALRSGVEDIREILGLGVVYRGFEVVASGDAAITVQPGLAFDFQKNRLVADEPKTIPVAFGPGEDVQFVCLAYEQVEDGKVEEQWTLIWDSCRVVLRPTAPEPKDNMVAVAKVGKADGGLSIVDLVRPAPQEAAPEAGGPAANEPPPAGEGQNGTTSPAPPAAPGAPAGDSATSTASPALASGSAPETPPPANGGVSTSTPGSDTPAAADTPGAAQTANAGGSAPASSAPNTAPVTSNGDGGANPGTPAAPADAGSASATNGSGPAGAAANEAPAAVPTPATSNPSPARPGVDSSAPAPTPTVPAAPVPPRWLVRQGVVRMAGQGGAATNLEASLVGPLRNKLAARNGVEGELRIKLFEQEIPLDFGIVSFSGDSMLVATVALAAEQAQAPPPMPAPAPRPISRLAPVVEARLVGALPGVASVPAAPSAVPPTPDTQQFQVQATAHGEYTFSGEGMRQFGVSTNHSAPGSDGAVWLATELTEHGIAQLLLTDPASQVTQQLPVQELLRHLQLIIRLDNRDNGGFKLTCDLWWVGAISEDLINRFQSYKPMLTWNGYVAWKAAGIAPD